MLHNILAKQIHKTAGKKNANIIKPPLNSYYPSKKSFRTLQPNTINHTTTIHSNMNILISLV